MGIGPNDLNTFGLIFETLYIRDLRVYAESINGSVYHYKDALDLECDAVIHLRNGSYGLIEIKLSGDKLINNGAKNLINMKNKIDTTKMSDPSFLMVLTSIGNYAYQREDGVSSYIEYDVSSISSEISLPYNTSTITYRVSITNFEAEEMTILNINGLSDNLEITEIINYNLGDKICDNNNQCSLGITKDILIKIKYKDGKYNSGNTKFSINLDFDFVIHKYITTTFDYTKTIEKYIVPYDGTYKLEVWGAQGGTAYSDTYRGGYGGYSTGVIELMQGEYLFIVVGGQGESGTIKVVKNGGYNGGGSIAASTDDPTNRYVASGGGGYKHTTSGYYGIGGYYGGGASHGGIRDNGNSSGGGRSSYIGSSNLFDKYMVCYECNPNDEINTKTISVSNKSDDPLTDFAKSGNGYAKITLKTLS